jgi:DNA-binding MarR family transcriptional regulator
MVVTLEAAETEWLAGVRTALLGLQGELSLGQLVALLTVACDPGLSVNDLADRTGVPQQTASRNVAMLLGRYEMPNGQGPQHPLISQGVSEHDPRKRALFLTDTGAELVGRLVPRALRQDKKAS